MRLLEMLIYPVPSTLLPSLGNLTILPPKVNQFCMLAFYSCSPFTSHFDLHLLKRICPVVCSWALVIAHLSSILQSLQTNNEFKIKYDNLKYTSPFHLRKNTDDTSITWITCYVPVYQPFHLNFGIWNSPVMNAVMLLLKLPEMFFLQDFPLSYMQLTIRL